MPRATVVEAAGDLLFCLGGMTRNALTAVPQIKELYNERYTKLRKDSSINSD